MGLCLALDHKVPVSLRGGRRGIIDCPYLTPLPDRGMGGSGESSTVLFVLTGCSLPLS